MSAALLLMALGLVIAPTRAGAAAFTGTLVIELGTLPPANFNGSGSVTSTPTQLTIPSGVFTGTFGTPITGQVPLTFINMNISNAPGSFTGTPLQGTMPIRGGANVLANLGAGPTTLVKVPFTVTSGGVLTAGLGFGGTIPATGGLILGIYFSDWRVGTAKITGVDISYTYHLPGGAMASNTTTYTYVGTVTRSGYDNRTPGGLGVVQLVSPTKVVAQLVGVLPVWSTITLQVPEPASGFLLGSLAVALAGFGFAHSRRR
jgi:hypothetical protein